ncbi:MAG: phosphoribosylanthranilate isomerase [Actinomycetia bacterium]|nr:phosphoribosylanthranilate isomerase [Actinomycetes bacterium]
MFVKICGITNEDDALLAVAMGADAVGFIFAPSSRQVAASQVYDITRRLPPEILTVGVFRDEHPSRVIDTVNRAGLKAAQLHGHESPAVVAEVSAGIRRVIKAVVAGSDDAANAHTFGTQFVLVDAPAPGSGKVFDWSLVDFVAAGPNIILAGGLTPDNVAAAVRVANPWGVDVSSGVERAPGKKDALKVKAFIERARAAAPLPHLGPDEMPYDWADDE